MKHSHSEFIVTVKINIVCNSINHLLLSTRKLDKLLLHHILDQLQHSWLSSSGTIKEKKQTEGVTTIVPT